MRAGGKRPTHNEGERDRQAGKQEETDRQAGRQTGRQYRYTRQAGKTDRQACTGTGRLTDCQTHRPARFAATSKARPPPPAHAQAHHHKHHHGLLPQPTRCHREHNIPRAALAMVETVAAVAQAVSEAGMPSVGGGVRAGLRERRRRRVIPQFSRGKSSWISSTRHALPRLFVVSITELYNSDLWACLPELRGPPTGHPASPLGTSGDALRALLLCVKPQVEVASPG